MMGIICELFWLNTKLGTWLLTRHTSSKTLGNQMFFNVSYVHSAWHKWLHISADAENGDGVLYFTLSQPSSIVSNSNSNRTYLISLSLTDMLWDWWTQTKTWSWQIKSMLLHFAGLTVKVTHVKIPPAKYSNLYRVAKRQSLASILPLRLISWHQGQGCI